MAKLSEHSIWHELLISVEIFTMHSIQWCYFYHEQIPDTKYTEITIPYIQIEIRVFHPLNIKRKTWQFLYAKKEFGTKYCDNYNYLHNSKG